MRARTVGDLRRELDGVDDAVDLVIEVDGPFYDVTTDTPVYGPFDLDVEHVDTTLPSHVTLRADRKDLP